MSKRAAKRRDLAADDRALLERVRETVHEIEPGAQIILYGSRARGDAEPDSDWDLLILLDGLVDDQRSDALHDALYDLGLETGALLIAIVRSKSDWETPRYRLMPFAMNVGREGIQL